MPSYKTLGVTAEHFGAPGKWCRYEWQPTGKTYTDKNNQQKEEKVLKIVEIFADKAAAEVVTAEETVTPTNGNGSNGHVAPAMAESRLFGVTEPTAAAAIMLKGYELGIPFAASFEFLYVHQGRVV